MFHVNIKELFTAEHIQHTQKYSTTIVEIELLILTYGYLWSYYCNIIKIYQKMMCIVLTKIYTFVWLCFCWCGKWGGNYISSTYSTNPDLLIQILINLD